MGNIVKGTDYGTEMRREQAQLTANASMSPDEVTTSDATLDTSMPEAGDGLAGFDSRKGGHHLLFALQPDFEVLDKGMTAAQRPYDFDWQFADPRRPGERRTPGRLHYSLNHLRPTRIVELHRKS
jgi:hypothetical protein